MLEQTKYLVRIWDQIGMPCGRQWAATRGEAIGLAESTAVDNAYATTVFLEGAVIARFDHRPPASG